MTVAGQAHRPANLTEPHAAHLLALRDTYRDELEHLDSVATWMCGRAANLMRVNRKSSDVVRSAMRSARDAVEDMFACETAIENLGAVASHIRSHGFFADQKGGYPTGIKTRVAQEVDRRLAAWEAAG